MTLPEPPLPNRLGVIVTVAARAAAPDRRHHRSGECRELILEALPMFSREEMGDHALKLDDADKAFMAGTREFKKCVWGGGTAKKEKWTPQKNWWYFRTPRRTNAQLEDELATVR